jgi:hypothetical protein
MPSGKKPGYAGKTSQRYWCEQCGVFRFGTVTHRHEEEVPIRPGSDVKRMKQVGQTTRCDKCGHETTKYDDD